MDQSTRQRGPHLFCRTPLARSLRYETLEDRRVLATLTVDTDQDLVDFNDGVTSLREAIFAANIVPGADEIVFDLGDGPKTILLTQGELKITDSLTITGSGAELLTVDASGNDPTPNEDNGDGSRVFNINDVLSFSIVITVKLVGLNLIGGDVADAGGAISARNVNLEVSDCYVIDNASRTAGGGLYAYRATGGGRIVASDAEIADNLTVTTSPAVLINQTIISGNRTVHQGGGVAVSGIPATIMDSKVENNSVLQDISNSYRTASGGGIFILNGELEIARSRIIDNSVFSQVPISYLGYNGGGGLCFVSYQNRSANANDAFLNDTVISGNSTSGTTSDGGGVKFFFERHNTNKAIINYCTIQNNSTWGHSSDGGGVYQINGELEIVDSLITGNRAESDGLPDSFVRGGGIASYSNKLTILSSTITSNSLIAAGSANDRNYGGGVADLSSLTSQIRNTTIAQNTVEGSGGGIALRVTNQGPYIIENVTISGNTSTLNGGGLFSRASVQLIHSTVTANISNLDNDGVGSGGGIFSNAGSVNLKHTIVAGNHDNSGTAHDIAGVVNSSYSLVGVGAEFLAPLADNGGPTKTHALLPGSPAINAGEPASVGGENGVPEFDQRGEPFTRVFGGRIDIGAFEAQSLIVYTLLD
jgi:hypothetical protein